MRGHWSVENQNHYMLDVYFGEDASAIRSGHAAKNLGILRRLCLNMLREAQKNMSRKKSIRRLMRCCALDDEELHDLLGRGLKLHAKQAESA